jgi:ubiquinone/menaquinone biosynthesis C-methylase UbiE
MTLIPEEWHPRFRQQAHWTRQLRHYLYQRAGLQQGQTVLDVGSGTGVLAAELLEDYQTKVYCVDLDLANILLAMRNARGAQTSLADAHDLPFPPGVFHLTLCHFLLLWVADPLQVVREMMRVTRPGGAVLALAEPDYGGRIDFPLELDLLGKLQAESLCQQGADPTMGRKLSALFRAAGLEQIERGVLGGQWIQPPEPQDWEIEWSILEADLAHDPERIAMLKQLKQIDQAAWQGSTRILYVPTFYAWGRVP